MTKTQTKCAECGGLNIQVKMWVNPNHAQIEVTTCEWADPDDAWCEDCKEHVKLKFKKVRTKS